MLQVIPETSANEDGMGQAGSLGKPIRTFRESYTIAQQGQTRSELGTHPTNGVLLGVEQLL